MALCELGINCANVVKGLDLGVGVGVECDLFMLGYKIQEKE